MSSPAESAEHWRNLAQVYRSTTPNLYTAEELIEIAHRCELRADLIEQGIHEVATYNLLRGYANLLVHT
jgi:hypothetical protein